MNTPTISAAAGFFVVVAGTDYFLDRNIKRALIVGAVALVAAYVVIEHIAPAFRATDVSELVE